MAPIRSSSERGSSRVPEPWVSVDAVAAHLGVRKDSVYRWIEQRGLPAIKIGKLWKLKISEVDAWMRARSLGDEESPAPEKRPSAHPRPRILIIDDDELIRDTLAEFLIDEGYEPLLAADGVDGFRIIAAEPTLPLLIILDLGMPNMDGIQFREEQLRLPKLASIPLIVLTGDKRAQMEGAVVLRKPVRLDELSAEIARIAESA